MSLVLDWIFPRSCLSCHKPGNYFCPKCLDKQIILSPKFHNDPLHEGSLSLFKYRSIVKQGIIELKYNFVSDLVDEFSKICSKIIINTYPHLLEYWQKNNFTIIPVPLFPSRHNWRGFNQSELLAKDLSKNLNLNYSSDILIRSVKTLAQVKFKFKRSRIKNMKDAFSLNSKTNPILPQNIILFDDVLTTGSTLKNSLKAFRNVGLSHCWFLTIAH